MKYPIQTRQLAFQKYLDGGSTLDQISKELQVSYSCVHDWHARDRWADKRRQIETNLYHARVDRFRDLLTAQGVGVLADHLRFCQVISCQVDRFLAAEV